MSSLWVSLQPDKSELRVSMSRQSSGPLLRARLPLTPKQPQALLGLLEAVSNWFGEPLCAVLDADGEDVRVRPEFWLRTLADVDSASLSVEWVSLPSRSEFRDRFLGEVPSSRRAARLIAFAAGGQR